MPSPIDIDMLSEEQLTTMLEVKKKKRMAEEARRRAKEEAERKAEDDKKRADEEERKKAEKEKNKTGDDRCAACIRTNMSCTFSAVSSKVTTCDRCRSAKTQCTLSEADKPRRRKRVDEVELPSGSKGNKRSRQLSLSWVDVEEADEKISVVAALEVLTEKVEQLTHVVAENFASHRKERQQMITALNTISGTLEDQERASKTEIEKDTSVNPDKHYKFYSNI